VKSTIILTSSVLGGTNFLYLFNIFPFSFGAVVGSGIRYPGWIKIRIRDKHPGSATLSKREGRGVAMIAKKAWASSIIFPLRCCKLSVF
jgi:hypothetical protein